jgi:hypothetical protein
MGLYDGKPCPCGSGLMSRWITDKQGIPLARTCKECDEKVRKKYRPEIFGKFGAKKCKSHTKPKKAKKK